MRVWVLGRGFPEKGNNMLGSFEFEQAQMLQRHGAEVWYPVVNICAPRETNRLFFSRRQCGGVTVVTLELPLAVSKLRRKKESLRRYGLRILFRYMLFRCGRPDVLHVHYPSIYPYGLFSGLQHSGVKLVGTEHWTRVQEKKLYPFPLACLKQSVQHYDALLAVGEPLRNAILELTGSDREIQVVPNVVSDEFRYAPEEKRDGMFRFLGIGRLAACKRFDLMIRAFWDSFADDRNVCLSIVGDGEERKNLEALIRELGCGDRVTLHGVMDRKEVPAFYRQCSALAVSSNLETFGVPIIEAMASGLPVVTTDAMGFPSLFSEAHGLIVPADDRAAFAKALKSLYEGYGAYDRAAIARYSEAHFSEGVIASRLLDVYRNLTKKETT